MEQELNLNTIPFGDEFISENYKMVEFKERGVNFRILTDTTQKNSSNKYMFGLIDKKGDFNWFFKKKTVANNRLDALGIFNVIEKYCNENDLGIPFAYKKTWKDTL